jgi:hypothetical protein
MAATFGNAGYSICQCSARETAKGDQPFGEIQRHRGGGIAVEQRKLEILDRRQVLGRAQHPMRGQAGNLPAAG